jgi:MFS family permease
MILNSSSMVGRGGGLIRRATPNNRFSTHIGTSTIPQDEENRIILPSMSHSTDHNYERGITWALYISYLTLMGSKISLPSTLSMLKASSSGLSLPDKYLSTPSQFMAHVLSLSTLSLALGKAVTGPIIDALGGIRSLQLALILLALLLFQISFTSSFTVFQYSWMAVDFIFASGWAACLNAISHTTHTRTRDDKNKDSAWTDKIRGLATSARVGNALFFSIFGFLLQWTPRYMSQNPLLQKWIPNTGQSWRMVYFFSGLVQAIPLILLFSFQKNNNNMSSSLSQESLEHLPIDSSKNVPSPFQCLWKECQTWAFWCQLVNRSVLILIASFLLFVPSYMTCCFPLSTSSAARVGSVYALGCLLALSPKMNQWIRRIKLSSKPTWNNILVMNTFLTCLLGCCLLQLGHVSKRIILPTWLGVGSMFLWGFSFAIPFYIPSSVYALARGGTRASATST